MTGIFFDSSQHSTTSLVNRTLLHFDYCIILMSTSSATDSEKLVMLHEFDNNKICATESTTSEVASKRLIEMYQGLCPFCSVPSKLPKSLPPSDEFVQYRIISSSIKGEAEVAI